MKSQMEVYRYLDNNSMLFNRNFNLIVIGQIVSVLGSAVLRFALDLYVLDVTGRADVFALVLALSAIPGIVLTPIGGAIADRFNRRNLMIILDACAGIVVLSLVLTMIAGGISILVIGITLGLLAIMSSIYQPTVQSIVPVLVSDQQLASANGVVASIGALAGMLGPVLGGLLYAALGINTLLVASCTAFFLSSVMEMFIHIPYEKRDWGGRFVSVIARDMKDGVRYILYQKPFIFRLVVLAALVNLFFSPMFFVGVPYMLRITMHSSDTMYGLGMGIIELSVIVGALATGIVSYKLTLSRMHWLMFIAAMLTVVMAVAVMPSLYEFGFATSFTLLISSAGLIVIVATLMNVFIITLVQKHSPKEILGKVMAIVMSAASCVMPIGQAIYGVVFENFNANVYVPVLCAFMFMILIAIASKLTFRKVSLSEDILNIDKEKISYPG